MTVGSTPINDSIANASAEWKEIVSDQRRPNTNQDRLHLLCAAFTQKLGKSLPPVMALYTTAQELARKVNPYKGRLGIPSVDFDEMHDVEHMWSLSANACRARDSQAALAISDTCSQVVVLRLERVFMRSSQATRLGASAVSADHSGVPARKSSCGAISTSASDTAPPAK
jgi:hypothetical protein